MSRDKEKDATEDYRALDVRGLHRAGVLVPGWLGNWQWTRRGAVVATIGIEAENRDRVRLRYQVTVRGERQAKDYPVPITWTPCHLGGSARGSCAPAVAGAWQSCICKACSPAATADA
ncbi:hypothetical protein ACFSVK_23875 [Azorhizophilus paspali]|uniref:hypothetical protein n=1 Tax=Azorhizophilus paspali TaxID=69963 RepID=UPI0036369EF2